MLAGATKASHRPPSATKYPPSIVRSSSGPPIRQCPRAPLPSLSSLVSAKVRDMRAEFVDIFVYRALRSARLRFDVGAFFAYSLPFSVVHAPNVDRLLSLVSPADSLQNERLSPPPSCDGSNDNCTDKCLELAGVTQVVSKGGIASFPDLELRSLPGSYRLLYHLGAAQSESEYSGSLKLLRASPCVTGGRGTAPIGTPCVFPFEYLGVSFDRCPRCEECSRAKHGRRHLP